MDSAALSGAVVVICGVVCGVVGGVKAKGGWLVSLFAGLVGVAIGLGVGIGSRYWIALCLRAIEDGGF